MKIRQAFLASVGLSVVLALAGAPASAQDAVVLISGPTTTNLVTSSVSGVPISGTVSGEPESVSFSGQAQITSRVVRDPDFGKPLLVLTIDLTSVPGVGSSTKAQYVIPSQGMVQRRIAASQQVEITFPFIRSDSKDPTSARSGVASFALDVNPGTGVIGSAKATVSSVDF